MKIRDFFDLDKADLEASAATLNPVKRRSEIAGLRRLRKQSFILLHLLAFIMLLIFGSEIFWRSSYKFGYIDLSMPFTFLVMFIEIEKMSQRIQFLLLMEKLSEQDSDEQTHEHAIL